MARAPEVLDMARTGEALIPPPAPLSVREQRELRAVLDELARWRAALLAARGGRPYPDAAEEFTGEAPGDEP